MISAQRISKRYGDRLAVDHVSFEVAKGELLGFIGANGAGKSTTMRILTGFLPASEGRAVVAGFDVFEEPMEVRRRVGYLPESPPLYPELTIGDYLRFVAEIREVPRARRTQAIGEAMERVGLVGWEARILGSLSKGYRQRVGLAQAVLHNPAVLVLDEPTSGLDPAQVVGIRELFRSLAEDRTVILSTHILTEVEQLCPRVVMIHGGRVVAEGPLDAVRARARGGVRVEVEVGAADVPPEAVATAMGAVEGVAQVRPLGVEGGWVRLALTAVGPADPRPAVAAAAAARGWSLRALERVVPSLEEAFLTIVGQEG